MDVFKHIDIAEPIWKTKSVGLAIDDVPIGQNIKITISYISKTSGNKVYPGEYIVEADKIRQYPTQDVKNVRVYIVPINELAKLTVFNNQKPNNMLFNSNELGKIIKESEEAKSVGFENKKFITPGKHILTLKSVTLEYAKSDNNPMIVAEFELDEGHNTIKEYMKIAGPNTDIPRQKLVKLFYRGFNYEIQPCNTEADLINQLIKFNGKKLTVVVRGSKKAYSFSKDGVDIVMEQVYPEFWYCGLTSEFDDLFFDESKLIKDLSNEDKEKLVRFAEINGGAYIPKSHQQNNNTNNNTVTQPTQAPKKIEEVKAIEVTEEYEKPVRNVVEEAKVFDKESENTSSNDDSDDFPF